LEECRNIPVLFPLAAATLLISPIFFPRLVLIQYPTLHLRLIIYFNKLSPEPHHTPHPDIALLPFLGLV
jgi:hypothetical protein